MKFQKTVGAIFLMMLLACGLACARDADGRLGFIRYPISTRPEFVQPGGWLLLEVAAPAYDNSAGDFHASLEKGGASISLDPARMAATGTIATYSLEVTIPQNTTPGSYALSVSKGAAADSSRRAVIVEAEFPGEYSIMHITDTHVGRLAADGAPVGEQVYTKMKDEANRLRPDLVIITGDDSDTSDPVEFRKFIEITEQIEAPTFVVPGNHDRENAGPEPFLGTGRYDFYFGRHFYLGFDTQYDFPYPDPSGQMDWIASEVRANKSAPFKALFSHRPDSDMRVVFTKVAMPMKVNLLLFGHTHADSVQKFGSLPSLAVTTPAALDGYYRVIKVKNDKVEDMQLVNILLNGEGRK